jgi:hypothetical protein
MEVTYSLYGPRDLNLEQVVLEDQGRGRKPFLKQEACLENNETVMMKRALELYFSWSLPLSTHNGELFFPHLHLHNNLTHLV